MPAPIPMAKHARRRSWMLAACARRVFAACHAPSGRFSSLSIIQALSTGRLMRLTRHASPRTLAANLVVEHVETESRLRLCLTIKLSLKSPDLFRCFEAHRQSPCPHYLRKHTRSQGPSLRRHYPASSVVRPCPTPARSAARCDVGVANSNRSGPPPITRITLPTCSAHIPRRPEPVWASIASPFTRPSPLLRRVGVRIFTFEACSGFTRGTAPWMAQPPRRPLSRGSNPAGRPTKLLVSYQINRQPS